MNREARNPGIMETPSILPSWFPGFLIPLWLFPCSLNLLLSGCSFQRASGIVPAQQDASETWWMRETEMATGGRLQITSKAWWARANELKTGESFVVDDNQEMGMLVRRERVTNRSRTCDAIVWVIDDDGDGSISKGGD